MNLDMKHNFHHFLKTLYAISYVYAHLQSSYKNHMLFCCVLYCIVLAHAFQFIFGQVVLFGIVHILFKPCILTSLYYN